MPNRIIKESICYSEDINELSPEEEIFFYRLIVNCDDFGRTDARLPMLKARLYPLKDMKLDDINGYLVKLVEIGLVFLYEHKGIRYLQLINWGKHQQVRATRSKYPNPDDENSVPISHDINCKQAQANVPENPIRESYSRSEKRDTQKIQGSPPPFSDIQDLWNDICKSLPKVTALTKKRKDKIKSRWNELQSLDKFKQIFELIEESNFLKGENEKSWKATFDWIMDNDNNPVKVLENQYTNKKNTKQEQQEKAYMAFLAGDTSP